MTTGFCCFADLEFLDEHALLVLHVCKRNGSAPDVRFVLSVLVYGTDWLFYQLKSQLDTRSCFLKFIDQTNKRKRIGLLFERKMSYQQKSIDLFTIVPNLSQNFQDILML